MPCIGRDSLEVFRRLSSTPPPPLQQSKSIFTDRPAPNGHILWTPLRRHLGDAEHDPFQRRLQEAPRVSDRTSRATLHIHFYCISIGNSGSLRIPRLVARPAKSSPLLRNGWRRQQLPGFRRGLLPNKPQSDVRLRRMATHTKTPALLLHEFRGGAELRTFVGGNGECRENR